MNDKEIEREIVESMQKQSDEAFKSAMRNFWMCIILLGVVVLLIIVSFVVEVSR